MLPSIFRTILLILAFSAGAFGQSQAKSLLLLTGGGLPLGVQFEVELNESGLLRVSKTGPGLDKDGNRPSTKEEIQLSQTQTDKLFLLAGQAVDFSKKPSGPFADGTTAGLRLCIGGKTIRRTCENAQKWPIGKKTVKLLQEINMHVSSAMRVF